MEFSIHPARRAFDEAWDRVNAARNRVEIAESALADARSVPALWNNAVVREAAYQAVAAAKDRLAEARDACGKARQAWVDAGEPI